MPVVITVFVIIILGVTHYTAYSAGRNTKLSLTKAKLKDAIMLELKDEQDTNSKGKNTKQEK